MARWALAALDALCLRRCLTPPACWPTRSPAAPPASPPPPAPAASSTDIALLMDRLGMLQVDPNNSLAYQNNVPPGVEGALQPVFPHVRGRCATRGVAGGSGARPGRAAPCVGGVPGSWERLA